MIGNSTKISLNTHMLAFNTTQPNTQSLCSRKLKFAFAVGKSANRFWLREKHDLIDLLKCFVLVFVVCVFKMKISFQSIIKN